MKGTFKALFILFIIVTLTVLCAVSVGAEEALPTEETAEQTAAAEGEANSDTEDADAQNPFEDFYTAVLSYSSEILCLITLILSLVLTHAYRRGLVPLVKGAVMTSPSITKKALEVPISSTYLCSMASSHSTSLQPCALAVTIARMPPA